MTTEQYSNELVNKIKCAQWRVMTWRYLEIISKFSPPQKVYVAMQTELDKSGSVATTAAGRALYSLYGSQGKERMKKLDELNRELQTLQEANEGGKEGPSLLDVMSDLAQMKEDLEYWRKKEDRLRGTFISSKPSALQLLCAKLMRWRQASLSNPG